jgi:hypothetical protein
MENSTGMKTLSDYPFLIGEVLKRVKVRERRTKPLRSGFSRMRKSYHLAAMR